MKKQLVASLAAAMVLGVAGTSFAATNPFSDVPAKHWAYDAVSKLAKAGIVDGYSDGTYKGDKVISRYEMAQMVAKAMAHSDKANAEQKAAIDKLSVEFASELEGLNVRVTKLENKVDNVKWGGEVRVRMDSEKIEGSVQDSSNSKVYADMWATAQINPDWIAKIEYENTKRMTNNGGSGKAGTNGTEENTTRIFAQGPLFGAKTTVGKFNPFAGYGLVIDDNMTGAQFEFGNVLKARVGYGKYVGNIGDKEVGAVKFSNGSPTYTFGELDLAASKVTNVKFAYHSLNNINSADIAVAGNGMTQDSIHYTEIGFDTKLAADWSLMATYAKSNLNMTNLDNKAYFTQLTYKAADIKKEGSFDIYANYRKIPVAAQMDSTWDYAKNYKGTTIGFDYVPATNIKLNAFYFTGKKMDNKTSSKDDKVYRAQVEFFF